MFKVLCYALASICSAVALMAFSISSRQHESPITTRTDVCAMCMSEFMEALWAKGLAITESQVRWAIRSGSIERPPRDGSLRFCFGPQHLRGFERLFAGGTRDRRERQPCDDVKEVQAS